MAEVNIKGPDNYHKYFHVLGEGNVWLDGKGKPIPLNSPLNKLQKSMINTKKCKINAILKCKINRKQKKMERKVMVDFLFSVDFLMLRCLRKS